MKKNYSRHQLRYDRYVLTIKERILYGLEAMLLLCGIGYFFYRSVWITLAISPCVLLFWNLKSKELCEKRRIQLQLQFKDILISVSGSIKAGYSLENAFVESYTDIIGFHGTECVAARELMIIRNGLLNGKNLTSMIRELGQRSEIADINDFANVLIIGNQSGGNIKDIIDSYIRVAEEKAVVLEEIETMISAKRYEQRIMNCIPFFIILYIELTSKGFFDCLYDNIAGRMIMTICLIVYAASVYMSYRITKISI